MHYFYHVLFLGSHLYQEKFYDCQYELVDHHEISISQSIIDLFPYKVCSIQHYVIKFVSDL